MGRSRAEKQTHGRPSHGFGHDVHDLEQSLQSSVSNLEESDLGRHCTPVRLPVVCFFREALGLQTGRRRDRVQPTRGTPRVTELAPVLGGVGYVCAAAHAVRLQLSDRVGPGQEEPKIRRE